jgi:hypothetical protein
VGVAKILKFLVSKNNIIEHKHAATGTRSAAFHLSAGCAVPQLTFGIIALKRAEERNSTHSLRLMAELSGGNYFPQ